MILPDHYIMLVAGNILIAIGSGILGFVLGGRWFQRVMKNSRFPFFHFNHFANDDSIRWIIYDKDKGTFHFDRSDSPTSRFMEVRFYE